MKKILITGVCILALAISASLIDAQMGGGRSGGMMGRHAEAS